MTGGDVPHQPPGNAYLDELCRSQAAVVRSVRSLTDVRMRGSSLLPGWSRDMLVAHLRYGADAAMRGIEGARTGGDTLMYPGGEDQRSAEIESGAGRATAQLLAELADACARIETTFANLPAPAWDALVLTRRGPIPVREVLLQRWLDVEVHHVDLDVDYPISRWPAALVETYLPRLVGMLPALRSRPDADRSTTGSWHLHRSDGQGEWTVYADAQHVSIMNRHEHADCAIRGSGRSLLALLLGRPHGDDLSVHGDKKLAAQLKTAFPGP
jgi:maleylpyruvate isomerase